MPALQHLPPPARRRRRRRQLRPAPLLLGNQGPRPAAGWRRAPVGGGVTWTSTSPHAQHALALELREYFRDLLSTSEREAMLIERHGETYRTVVRRMGRDGWLGVGWPTEYGGRGFGLIEQQIFVNEAARADVPLPAVTSADRRPDAAGATARRRRRTSSCRRSSPASCTSRSATPNRRPARTWRRCVPARFATVTATSSTGRRSSPPARTTPTTSGSPCRTDPNAPRHKGISILIVDTRDPGYSWTPIITCDGAHHVNATYYSDVRVPADMLVGKENAGWRLITTQLNHERVMLGPAGRLAALYERVRDWAAARDLLDEPDVRRTLAKARAPRAGERAAELAGRGRWRRRVASRTRRRRRCSSPTGSSGSAGLLEDVVRHARRPGRRGDRRADAMA